MTTKNILNASFKRVPFFVESENLQRFGRMLARHEYPNTSEQFAEDTGGFAREFEVTGFVVGDNAKDQLNAVINACNEQGAGRLVLPFWGEMDMLAGEGSVEVSPYTDNEKLAFKIIFCESRKEGGLVAGEATLTETLAKGETARAGMLQSFTDNYKINSLDALSKITATADLRQIIGDMTGLSKFLPAGDVAAFMNKVDSIARTAGNLINDGFSIGQSLMNKDFGIYSLLSTGLIGGGSVYLINTLLDVANTFKSKQTKNPKYLESQAAGADIATNDGGVWVADTPTRRKRNEQRATLGEVHRFNIITIAYECFAGAKFETDTDAENMRTAIENAYINLVHGIDGITNGVPIITGSELKTPFSLDTRTIMPFDDLRLTALETANNGAVVQYKVEREFNYKAGSSILVLAYLTQAERLTDENELIQLANAMRNANNRATYNIKGGFTVLRGAL